LLKELAKEFSLGGWKHVYFKHLQKITNKS
jgi:hypothetical protein